MCLEVITQIMMNREGLIMKTILSSGNSGGIILLQEYGTRWAQMATCPGNWHLCHLCCMETTC
uniref:Alternative protein KLHDC10 n=1 Tax=Homo sapiens TaxID=9606 RepID=L8E8L8_HUMAN|nr:alternative protein KLHDC10 [Homo sapiens]